VSRIVIPSFDCSTVEKRDNGFKAAQSQPFVINTVRRYEIQGGCQMIQVEAPVSTIRGNAVLGYVKDSGSETGFMACGDVDGRKDPLSSCVRFINDRGGQHIYVKVMDGGQLVIN
jgi:hypothetical protein